MLRRVALGFLLALAGVTVVGGLVALHYVRAWDAVVSEKFRTHRWTFPSKVYADSVLVYPGMDLQAVGFADRLRELGYQAVQGKFYQGARDNVAAVQYVVTMNPIGWAFR